MNAFNQEICSGDYTAEQKEAAGCNETRSVGGVAGGIINVVFGVIAVVAVITIILSGVQYMTSQGDPQKVKTAKNTLTYSIMGLVIALLAFAITRFVIRAFE